MWNLLNRMWCGCRGEISLIMVVDGGTVEVRIEEPNTVRLGRNTGLELFWERVLLFIIGEHSIGEGIPLPANAIGIAKQRNCIQHAGYIYLDLDHPCLLTPNTPSKGWVGLEMKDSPYAYHHIAFFNLQQRSSPGGRHGG